MASPPLNDDDAAALGDADTLAVLIEFDRQLVDFAVSAVAPPDSSRIQSTNQPSVSRGLDLIAQLNALGTTQGSVLSGRAADTTAAELAAAVVDVTADNLIDFDNAAGIHSIGRYQILKELGRGGFGVVFLADDPSLERHVALKVPRPEALLSASLQRRFRREALAAARLTHPNIVALYEVGKAGPIQYLASAYCEGPTLAEWRRDHVVTDRDAARVLYALADAVEYAHRNGVLHRDLKPGNVLLDLNTQLARDVIDNPSLTDYTPKLTDFGLALLDEAGSGETKTIAVVGTPAYMAPEQASGQIDKIGPTTDVYGLGTILYELLTGQPPHRGRSDRDTMRSVSLDEPTAPRRLRPAVSRDLESICLKCLEQEPARRYASAEKLREDLGRFLRDEPIRARRQNSLQRLVKWARRRPAAAALVCVSIAAVLALIGLQSRNAQQLRIEIAATQRQREAAEHERDRATQRESDTQDLLYATRLQTASAAWRRHDCRTLNMLLAEAQPASTALDRRGFEWHYLWHLGHQQRQTFAGHDGEVYCHALSADARHLATGDVLGRIVVWNVADGSARTVALGISDPSPSDRDVHRTCINGLVFLPDGRLVSAGCDGILKVWSWQQAAPPQVLVERGERANCICLTPDGSHLAAGWEDGLVQLIDVAGVDPLVEVQVAKTGLETIAISPDGTRMAVGGDEPLVHILDARTGARLMPALALEHMVYAVAFSPDGQQLAVAPKDESPLIFNANSGEQLVRVDEDLTRCFALAFSPDGATLVGGSTGAIVTWDAQTGTRRGAHHGHTMRIATLSFTPDGQSLVSASFDREVRLWDTAPPRDFEPLAGMFEAAGCVAFCSRQNFVVCADGENRCLRFDLESGRQLGTPTPPSGAPVNKLILSPSGRYLIVYRTRPPAEVYDLQSSQGPRQSAAVDIPDLVHFSPDESLLATTSNDNRHRLRVLELPSGQLKIPTTEDHALAHIGWPNTVAPDIAFASDGREVVIANGVGIGRWDLATGSRSKFLAGQHDLFGLASKSELALTLGPGGLCVFDLRRFQPVRTLQRIATAVFTCGCWSPDDRRVATGHDDGSIHLWDVATGMELVQFEGHSRAIRQLAFSPDGTRLYSFAPRTSTEPEARSELFVWNAEPAAK